MDANVIKNAHGSTFKDPINFHKLNFSSSIDLLDMTRYVFLSDHRGIASHSMLIKLKDKTIKLGYHRNGEATIKR